MAERLKRALTANDGGTPHVVKVVEHQRRGDLAWVGGSILASLSTFQSMWVSRDEYLEQGGFRTHHTYTHRTHDTTRHTHTRHT